MGELSIKIKIGEREYPMRVDSTEEERIRLAGRLINEKMKTYREKFGIDDKQDLLAMVAFDFLNEKMRSEAKLTGSTDVISSKLLTLEKIVDTALSE